ncbi:MFS transporter [Paraburkholderia sp. ZP32-5]|uniref:MFS transporter n=1 Tax=Paraburkholderia sp. ZP32-5 TaxID=2883245 RepID=UPI001F3B018C|nr:MFS transporter [Paraburkholderia sp. ZP32-5]
MSDDTVQSGVVRVTQLVDEQRIGRFLISIMVLGFLCQIGDGYDLAAAAYAAVGIARDWHIERSLLAPVFSASLVGMMFGAPLFGFVGDRFGRRAAIIVCSTMCGLFSLATAGAHSLLALAVLRFFTGIGLGGLPTNTIALMAEYAPARARAVLITLMFMGITLGGTVPAVVAALVPNVTWHLLFLVGGVLPIVAALLNFAFLPESMKFLALRDPRHPQLITLARRMRPELSLPDKASFIIATRNAQRFAVRMLFEGKLRWITPLIWMLFITNLMSNFFLNSWMPTLLHASGLSPAQAAIAASMYYFGGVVGGLAIAVALDRGMLGIVGVFMLLACPAVAWLGTPGFSPVMLKLSVFLVGVTVLGNQLGLNSVVGLSYPTAIRANGTGWALGVGRVGAILGPLVGGQLIHAQLPLRLLFLAPIAPLAIGAVAALILRPLARDRFARVEPAQAAEERAAAEDVHADDAHAARAKSA